MYLFIYNRKNQKPIFSSNFGYDEEIYLNIIDSYLKNGNLPAEYSIETIDKSNLIYIGIKKYKASKSKNEKDKKVIKKIIEKVSEVVKEDDLFQGSRNNLKVILDYLFPYDFSFKIGR